MLAADPALRRLALWGRLLKFPVIASLALVAAAIVLSIALDPGWVVLLAAAGLLWLLFARLSIHVFRELHQKDYRWRLDHAPQRERTLLRLAQRATWAWSEEVPETATHAVLVVAEIGGQIEVEDFCDEGAARARLERRADRLAGESEPIVVGLVELDAEPERALIAVEDGRPGERRALDSLPLAEDGWLVGI
jgi:hypothetical protein